MNEIKKQESILNIEGCKLTSKGAIFDRNLSFENWKKAGSTLRYLEKSVLFWIGDWINYGEKAYGEKYAQALEDTGYEYGTLRNAAYVSASIDLSRRRDNLPFSHHQEVAGLDLKKQEEMLDLSSKENMTRKDLRREIHEDIKKLRREVLLKNLNHKEDDRIRLLNGDFREVGNEIKSNSVDLVLTDPPYPKEFLPLWKDLSKFSERILKPGGFLVTYSGQLYLPEVISSLGSHLEYYWMAGLYHEGVQAQRFERHVQNAVKPILIYFKPPIKTQSKWLVDLIDSPAASKEFHEWGQSIEPVKLLLETFSEIDSLVVDPFAGGGTTAMACKELLRKCVCIELEKDSFEMIKARISQ